MNIFKYLRLLGLTLVGIYLISTGYGQTFNYTDGALDVDVFVSNPCDGANNGSITFTVNAAFGGSANLQVFGPPSLPVAQSINVGNSFTFDDGGNGLPSGTYDFILVDPINGDIVNTFSLTHPSLTLTDLTAISITINTQNNNTSCPTPNGEIEVVINNGSGSFTYSWTGPGGFNDAGTNTNPNPINISNLIGGTYTLTVNDDFSVCSFNQDIIITDPALVAFNITNASPFDVCSGSDLVLSLDGTENGVTYTVYNNGAPTAITAIGDGVTVPFNITVPNGSFADSDVLTIEASAGPCTPVFMNGSVTANIITAPDAGTDNTVDACNTDNAFDLFASLGGTPDAGGAWTDLDGSGGTITGNDIDLTAVTAGTYRFLYTVTGTAPCVDATATVTVNVNDQPDAGTDNTVNACNSENAFDLFASLGGTPDAGGAWTDLDGSGGTITGNDIDLTGVTAGTYRFLYTVTATAPCIDATATVTVNVIQAADAGTDNTVSACETDNAFDLFASLGGTPDAGGAWTDLDGSGGTITGNDIDLTAVTAGTYRFLYTVTGTAPCVDATATVTVNVIAAPDAGTDNTVNACNSENAFDLFASLGGTPDAGGAWTDLDGSGGTITGNDIDLTAVTAGTYRFLYTVTGTAPCVDATATVTVNVIQAADAGTDNTVSACETDNAFDLFASLGGTPDAGGAWTDLDGSGGTITGNDIDLTAVTAGTYRFLYTVTGTAPCVDATATVTVNVIAAPDAGTDNTVNACNSNNAFDLFASLGGTPDAGGAWTDLDGSGGTITGNDIDLTAVTAGTYRFLYTVTGTAPCVDATATVTVNVNDQPDAGTDNTVSACNSENAFDLFASLGGTPDAGGAWTDLDGSGGTITGNDIDLTGVTAGTYRFLYTVTATAPCIDATATVTVNVIQAADAGTDNTVSACETDNAFDLFASLGGTPDAGGAWTDLDGSGGTITGNDIDLTGVTAGTYRFLYTVTGTAPCVDATATVTVNVIAAPDAGTDNTVNACNSENAFDLFASLGGTPDAGGAWTDLDGSGGTITGNDIDLTAVTAGTYRFLYTVTGTAPCVDATATVTVNVIQAADAGTDNTVSACETDNAFDLFASLGGTPDAGGAWTDLDGSGGTITGNDIDLTAVTAGTYRFLYTVTGTAPCVDATATVTVNVIAAPDAGTDNTVNACNSNNAFDLFASLGGTPDAGGAWTDLDGSGGTITGNDIDLTAVTAGTYRFLYTVTGTAPCVDATATVTVNVIQAADAGIDNTVNACETDNAFDLFASLGGTPDAGGAWTDLDGSGGTITGNDIDLTAVVPGTYRFLYVVTGTAPCAGATATVTVNVIAAPDAGTNNTVDACTTDNAFDLFASLGGTPDAGGAWADLDGSGGTITGNNIDLTAVTAGTYRFIYTVSAAPCTDATAQVTVNVVQAPNPGIDAPTTACISETALDLFAALGGTPDAGGTWTDNDGIGGLTGNILDLTASTAAVGNSYSFTYTVTGTGPCANATATVTVNVTAAFNPGTDNTVDACLTDTNFDLFAAIGGTPDPGGTWTDNDGIGGLTGNILDLTASTAIAGNSYTFTYTLSGGGCVPASSTVTINAIAGPDAGADNTINACNTNNALDLFASLGGTPDVGGTWTDLDASGGTITGNDIDLTTVTAGTYRFLYAVTGTAPCVDATAIVTANVNDQPDAGADNTVNACETDNAFDLFASLTGTPDAGGAWTDLDGSGGTITGNDIDLTAVAPGTYRFLYTVTGTAPCIDATATVTVNVIAAPDAGTDNTVNVCNSNNAFDLFASLGGTPDAGGVWTDLDGSGGTITGNDIDLTGVTAGTYRFSYTVSSAPCPDATATLTLNVIQAPDSGVDAPITACITDPAVDLFAALGGTPDAGGTWVDVNGIGGLTGNILDLTASTAIVGGSYTFTYTVNGAAPCADATSTVTVNVTATFDAGTDNTVNACLTDTNFNLFTSLGGTPNPGGTWTDNDGIGGLTGDILDLTASTATAGNSYTFTYTLSGGGCTPVSSTVTVNVIAGPNAGTDNTVNACNTDPSFDLFASLSGTPDAGGAWTDLDGSGGTITGNDIDLTTTIPGTYRFLYTVTGVAPCVDATATVTVNVTPAPNAGLDNAVNACDTNVALDLFGSLGGTPDAGGAWTDLDASGGTITGNNVDLTGVAAGAYRFQYTVSAVPCADANAIVTVNVIQSPNAGTNSTVTVCLTDTNFDLLAALGGTPDAGGTWTDVNGIGGLTGNILDLTASTAVDGNSYDFTYTVSGTAPCTDQSATVTINVTTSFDAGADNTVDACIVDNNFDLFAALGGTPDAGGAWTDNDGIGGLTGNILDVAASTATAGNSYTFTYTLAGGGCPTVSSVLTVNIIASPDAGTDNLVSACINNSTFDLFAALGGTPDTGGIWIDVDGIGGLTGNILDLPTSLAVAGNTYAFTYLIGAAPPCTNASATVTITVLPSTDATCSGGGGSGDCATVVITPTPSPATCTNSDGSIFFDINPAVPAINTVGVIIDIDGPVQRTNFNDPQFNNLPIGVYDYTITYGDPACVKTGQVTVDQSGTVGTPIATNPIDAQCFGQASGAVTIDVAGETGNLLEWSIDGINWTTFIAGDQITGIPAGPAPTFERVISVRRTAADPCNAAVTVVINEPNEITLGKSSIVITPATCVSDDGSIEIGNIQGGTAPYSFVLDGTPIASLPADNTFRNLRGGFIPFTIIDANSCSKDTTFFVPAPGLVDFSVLPRDPDCNGGGQNGSILAAVNPLQLPGSYEAAISQTLGETGTFQAVPPGGSIEFTDLAQGRYYITVQSADGSGCPNQLTVDITGGPVALDFDLEEICLDDAQAISLTNISALANTPFDIEVYRVGSINPVTVITLQDIPAGNEYIIADENFFISDGNYQVRLSQQQPGCVDPLVSTTENFVVTPPLAAEIGTIEESFPERGTGTIEVNNITGGSGDYEILIEPDGTWDTVRVNQTTLEFEFLYDSLLPGSYNITIRDSKGCTITLDATVPQDENVFIPNVFTPNNDGANDRFFIRNLPSDNTTLTIRNRWGKVVYKQDNYKNDWDGESNGDGMYFYTLELGDGTIFKGWVEIWRGGFKQN
ncbi:gliding motility-associated C-terminal domain-containing protein [Fulvivirgaceae bacterium BMA10]|uniref:Gliding motility-associated C-terminal domain-containing protein n=1 Tax=Splendidivirga corallicola TaxID=3051826 RepID=A0ABT8KP86_9BACT|nr:gliding motility-associated C-terminal domain-containing protein [Fulvivirgaceae bacterium BMA10]